MSGLERATDSALSTKPASKYEPALEATDIGLHDTYGLFVGGEFVDRRGPKSGKRFTRSTRPRIGGA